MINPSDLRHLVDNEKVMFHGGFRTFDEIAEDDAILEVFLEATEKLVSSESVSEIADFASNLKVKLENFAMSHDYSDLASRVNELAEKISIFQKALDQEDAPEKLLTNQKRDYLSYLEQSNDATEAGFYLACRFPELKNDRDVGVSLFKKFPKEFDVLFDEPLKSQCMQDALASTGLSDSILAPISKIKNYEIRDFLYKSLFEVRVFYADLDDKNVLPLLGFLSLKPSAEQIALMKTRLDDFSKIFKDGSKLQDILNLQEKLCCTDKVAEELKAGYFLDCFQLTSTEGVKSSKKAEIKARDNQETVKRIKLMLASLNVLEKADLSDLEEIDSSVLIDKLTGPLFAKVGIRDGIHKIFAEKFLESRLPLAIFQYASVQDEPEVFEAIGRFIQSVCSDSFLETRHACNSHKDYLDADTLKEWVEGGKETWPDGSIISDSEDWQDLFLCGTEVTGSCQAVNGSSDLNKALLGYVLDGKCRVMCLKDREGGPIRARAIFKIMLDADNKPVLFLENSYPPGHKDKFITFALERAQAIGLPLFIQSSTEFAGLTYEVKEESMIHSVANTAPYEYSDAAGGLQAGIYSHEGLKIEKPAG